VLCLAGEQVESLFDEVLPIEVRELPGDLARLDELLGDPALLAPIAEQWEAATSRSWPSDDRDVAVRADDGRQAAHWLGL
jgi:hypothetical protein